MDVGQLSALLQQQAQFFQQTVEQQTNTLAQAMYAMADVMRTLQADRVPVKEKELMTTKRVFTMLPNCSGHVEEYENWRFQMAYVSSQEPFFVEFLEWIEHALFSEDQHSLAVEDKNILHDEKNNDATADHSKPTNAARKEANERSYEVSSVGMVQPAALPSASSQLQGRGACHDEKSSGGKFPCTITHARVWTASFSVTICQFAFGDCGPGQRVRS